MVAAVLEKKLASHSGLFEPASVFLVKLLLWCPSFDSLGTSEVSFGSASPFCWNRCIIAINWFSSFLSEEMAGTQNLLLHVLTVPVLELCRSLLRLNCYSYIVGHSNYGKRPPFGSWASFLPTAYCQEL